MNKLHWTPSEDYIQSSNMFKFKNDVESKFNVKFNNYNDLHKWSVDNYEEFWKYFLDYSGIIYSQKYNSITSPNKIQKSINPIPRPTWFDSLKMNFAENLLKFRDDRIAIIHWAEEAQPIYITYSELYSKVAKVANGLIKLGVQKNDRVAGVFTNCPEAVICMLATTSIGAIWSSCSPDFGEHGIYERFGQIQPKIFLSVDGYRYGGKVFDIIEKVENVSSKIGDSTKLIIVNNINSENIKHHFTFDSLIDNDAQDIEFAQLEFDHPIYIMFSSGTTGVPKCIVHGAGGTLIQHLKELQLHCNLRRDDTISYFTTCGWMMWNWLVSSLAVGSKVFLFDGSPAFPNFNILYDAIDKEQINVFGTSPKFLTSCEKSGSVPKNTHNLSSLKVILSTGSPLGHDNFEYVYISIKSDVQLSSISGGTDIISCFMLGNPMLPVYSEEIQCIGLGMNVQSFDENGNKVSNEKGELVCQPPFPSMPIYFWNDTDNALYYNAYFNHFDNIWRHGDFVKITTNGGIVVYGRSDATLNPGGIRIGTAEIYRIVESIEEIADSLVVGPKWENDVRVVLFVVMRQGYNFTDELIRKIKTLIRDNATPRHVPAIIKPISEVPITRSGKKVELAVTKILDGEEVKNKTAIANEHSLDQFYGILDK